MEVHYGTEVSLQVIKRFYCVHGSCPQDFQALISLKAATGLEDVNILPDVSILLFT